MSATIITATPLRPTPVQCFSTSIRSSAGCIRKRYLTFPAIKSSFILPWHSGRSLHFLLDLIPCCRLGQTAELLHRRFLWRQYFLFYAQASSWCPPNSACKGLPLMIIRKNLPQKRTVFQGPSKTSNLIIGMSSIDPALGKNRHPIRKSDLC